MTAKKAQSASKAKFAKAADSLKRIQKRLAPFTKKTKGEYFPPEEPWRIPTVGCSEDHTAK